MSTPGLQIEYLTQGQGPAPRPGDTVVVHYTGWLSDGQKFDSSLDRAEPFQFVLGRRQVIEGWEVALAQMQVGDRVRLTLPPELAYGDRSPTPSIPPNSTLIFEIEFLEVRRGGGEHRP
jgi:FKBP-type peptidyl-prolyl cis-trans isomerase